MMARCVRVPREGAEEARRKLMEAGMLDLDHRIRRDGDSILIPVLAQYDGDTEEADLQVQKHEETDYRNLAEVPPELKEILPSSFDVVGDIAIMKLPEELLPYKASIGNALLRTEHNLRAVFLDSGVKGEYRIRDLERIAGEGTPETIHRENGVRMMTDPSKVYFNPRLAGERARVASLVKDGEVIIDMFAGVAPFGTVIARHAHPSKIYSIDLNPECERFMKENVRLNGITCMETMIGDSVELVKTLPKADRVIMNLPQMADKFLDSALRSVKPTGTIHMHKIMERADLAQFENDIVKRMADEGLGMRIAAVRELKTYSPTMSVYVFDIVPAEPFFTPSA